MSHSDAPLFALPAGTGPLAAAEPAVGAAVSRSQEPDEVLREQVALLRHNFPMTLLASLATALGTLWIMVRVVEVQAITVWLLSHTLVVALVYLTLRTIAPGQGDVTHAARKLFACMAAMGLSWGSLGYVVLRWGTPESVIYSIGIISTVSSGRPCVSAAPLGPAGTTAYWMSGPTTSARLVGSVHGVVVQARARTPVSPSTSARSPTSGKVTVTVWSWRIL